ncbi:ATPase [Micromonospora sp. DT31]|uniref:ATPase n=1 Tax=Micromonospora sp. DT31 TaxID=3393434 RepID=UPI003CF4D8A7
MRFSVVEAGYDRRQVDACLDELGLRLGRLAARAEGIAGVGREWDQIRSEALQLCDFLQRRTAPEPDPVRRPDADREAAELLTRARAELEAARAEARRLREEAYAEAVRARREFEAGLVARRRREAWVDELLTGVRAGRVPVDTPTAAAGVPSGGAGRPAAH